MSSTAWFWFLTITIILGAAVLFNEKSQVENPTLDVKSDTQIKATTIPVGTFYDGKDGYTLAIPSGNTSICTWNYVGGNAAIPYIKTTSAKSATEKHTIYVDGYYDWKVTCVDDFGNHYMGIFPKTE